MANSMLTWLATIGDEAAFYTAKDAQRQKKAALTEQKKKKKQTQGTTPSGDGAKEDKSAR